MNSVFLEAQLKYFIISFIAIEVTMFTEMDLFLLYCHATDTSLK